MPNNLPEFQRSVNLSGQLVNQDYTGVYGQLAQTPNALGQMASDIAQRASNQFSMAMGYKAGENPRGSIIPAFNESDKAFVQAYHASAKTTLTLQANEALQKAQLTLASESNLNQDKINTYATNLTQTFDDLMGMAPDAIKNDLKNSLKSSLDNSVASLQLKLIKQQRQEQIDSANEYLQVELKNILNTASDNPALAKDIQTDYLNTIQSYVDQHLISKKMGAAAKDSAEISLQTGRIIGQADRVMNGLPPFPMAKAVKGGIDEYMANLSKDEELAQMPIDKQQAVLSNVIKQVKLKQGLQSQYQSDVLSEGYTRIKSGNMTSEFYAHAQETLRPDQFSRLQAAMIHTNLTEAKNQQQLLDALNVYESASGSVMISDKIYHQATLRLIEQKMTQEGADRINATVEVLSHAGRPDPYFNKALENELLQLQPETFENAVKIADGISQTNPANLSISNEAQRNLIDYQQRAAAGGGKPFNIILDEMKEENKMSVQQREFISQGINDIMKTTFSTPSSTEQFVKNLIGIRPNETANMAEIGPMVKGLYRENLQIANGKQDLAKTMTQKQISNLYGYSFVNGKKEFTYLPVEKYLGLPDDKNALPFIYNSMANQLETQLQSNNNNPNSPVKYAITNRPNINAVLKAKKDYEDFNNLVGGEKTTMNFNQILKKTADLNISYLNKLKEFKNQRLEVTQDLNGQRTKLYIGYKSPAPLGISSNNLGQVVGDWQIVAWNEDGRLVPFLGLNLSNHQPIFRPNKTEILNGYASLYSINAGDHLTTEQKIAEIRRSKDMHKRKKQDIEDAVKRLSLFGGGQ